MCFCVDVGNSNTVIGLFEKGKLAETFRIATVSSDTSDDLKSRLFPLLAEKINTLSGLKFIISSVVPNLNRSWLDFSKEVFKLDPLLIGPGLKTGVNIAVDNPKEVGADRIVNAVAASSLYPEGALVVDSGTAVTIDVVSPDKSYLGGSIMPGIAMSMDALASKTAQLGRVFLQRPESVIGKNTKESIKAGIFFGFVGMIDRVIEETVKEINFKPKIVATGGLASQLMELSNYIDHYEEHLTLQGLYLIAQRN